MNSMAEILRNAGLVSDVEVAKAENLKNALRTARLDRLAVERQGQVARLAEIDAQIQELEAASIIPRDT